MNNYLKGLQLLIISLLYTSVVYSQNLVLNPSFEEYSICPDASGQIEYSVGWYTSSIIGTPDYYHICSSNNGIPSTCNCSLSFQYPKEGNAQIGIWTYSAQQNNVREYVYNKLKDSLIQNKCYYFSMYINNSNWSGYGASNIGIYFSNDYIFNSSNNALINLQPQIYWNSIVYDTLNWVHLYGVYKADTNNKYITIGNFFDDSEINVNNFSTELSAAAYYLIDDISLYQLGDGYAGKDSTIRIGDSIFLGQDVENLPTTWRTIDGTVIANNVSGVLVSPTVTTTYVCEQSFCGEVMYDTIVVTVVDDVGLESLEDDRGIRIYPNPSNGEFYINISENNSQNQLLEILDMSGKLVYSDNIQFENGSLKLIRNLESGIYVFKLTDGQTKEQILKKVTIYNNK